MRTSLPITVPTNDTAGRSTSGGLTGGRTVTGATDVGVDGGRREAEKIGRSRVLDSSVSGSFHNGFPAGAGGSAAAAMAPSSVKPVSNKKGRTGFISMPIRPAAASWVRHATATTPTREDENRADFRSCDRASNVGALLRGRMTGRLIYRAAGFWLPGSLYRPC